MKKSILQPKRAGLRAVRLILTTVLSFLLAVLSTTAGLVHASNGDLDPGFGSGGKVTTDFASAYDQVNGLVIQPDGKIVVAGASLSPVTQNDFALARYNTDGSLDSSFGSGGKLTTDILGSGSIDIAMALALQTDGKIVVAGTGNGNFALVRYNPTGTLDTSFGSGGKVTTDFLGFVDVAEAIVIQPDGKLVAVGGADTTFAFPRVQNFAVARYNPDGSLDTGFGVGGKATTDFVGLDDSASAAALQSDGKIVAVGRAEHNAQFHFFDFALVRYNSDGTLDSGFGVNGKLITDFFGSFDEATSVVIQPDTRIVAAGGATNVNLDSETDFGLARYNSNGTLDPGFGTNGKVMTDFPSLFDEVQALALQPDGKIVAAGLTENPNETLDFALARYNPDGSLDSGFGVGGKVKTDFFGSRDAASAVALQSDGKIVAAGLAENAGIGDFGLARYSGSIFSFDVCIRDDSSSNLLLLNSSTGDYQFTNCSGLTLEGVGSVIRRGATITLQHSALTHRVQAKVDLNLGRGSGSIQDFTPRAVFTLTDRNINNNNCACQ